MPISVEEFDSAEVKGKAAITSEAVLGAMSVRYAQDEEGTMVANEDGQLVAFSTREIAEAIGAKTDNTLVKLTAMEKAKEITRKKIGIGYFWKLPS